MNDFMFHYGVPGIMVWMYVCLTAITIWVGLRMSFLFWLAIPGTLGVAALWASVFFK